MNKRSSAPAASATAQNPGAPQDENPGGPRDKRKRNTAPGMSPSIEKPRPNEKKKPKSGSIPEKNQNE